jgi:uncharacterized protein YbaP (TraB family)
MRAYVIALCIALSAPALADATMFAEQRGTRGILYAVHGKHAASPTLWLYGTIHVGKSDVTPFSHVVLAALSTTKRLALEADVGKVMDAAAQMIRLGRYPAGDDLDHHIPVKLAADLHALLRAQSVSVEQIEPMRPWAASAMLEILPATKAGLDSQFAADSFLAAWAQAHHVPIVELEGFTYQLELMSRIPELDQVEMLGDAVKELAKPESSKEMLTLYEAWEHGDEKRVLAELDKEKDKSPASQRFQKLLLDDRNVGMADKAEKLIVEPGDTFLAVGSAHLLGKKGLVALLKARGYDVRPVR